MNVNPSGAREAVPLGAVQQPPYAAVAGQRATGPLIGERPGRPVELPAPAVHGAARREQELPADIAGASFPYIPSGYKKSVPFADIV
ncbi:hypothetical protein [Burkholderia ubonensis]|uniref:hypothetical protein n=1 Tax=Burkholderia ubonensis TaxID=101571 RepID=UPI0012F83A12|nr:hypothetical protein [Burkholderia ubonensis]